MNDNNSLIFGEYAVVNAANMLLHRTGMIDHSIHRSCQSGTFLQHAYRACRGMITTVTS